MFIGAIMCVLSLLAANFGVEYFINQNYMSAAETTYHQMIAIAIYYGIWVRPEQKQYVGN
jgi:hypothetical protein